MKTGQFFEINISQKRKHVFATDSSIRHYSESHIVEMLELFKQRFPKEEGYDISVTTWSCGCPKLPDAIEQVVPKTVK